MGEEQKLSILGHLQDLRTRLMRISIAVAIGIVIAFIFRSDIVKALRDIADDLSIQIIGTTEGLVAAFQLAIMCGIVLATPVILYEMVMFVRPALTVSERRYLYYLLPGVLIAFACGVAFAYFILLPPALDFLVNFSENLLDVTDGSDDVNITLSNYVNTVIRLMFGVGISFELPIIMFFLSKIGILKVHQLTRFRRWAIVLAFLLAALITPTPDPINQTLVAVPLILLYELGIIFARVARRGKESEEVVPEGTFKK